MLMSSRRHRIEMERLAAEVQERDVKIAQLEARSAALEKSRHDLVEEMRYVIESGAEAVAQADVHRANQLKALGHVLPYILSGRRHWDEPGEFASAQYALEEAGKLAETSGFTLPTDPVEAVKAMLDLAFMLFTPSYSLPVEGLRIRYPLRADSAAGARDQVFDMDTVER